MKMFAAAVAALLVATPAAAETYGAFEVGVASPGAVCALGIQNGSTSFMLALDGVNKVFMLSVVDPRIAATDGGAYPFTLTLDGETFTGTALGVNRGGVHGFAIIYSDLANVYQNLQKADVLQISVGGAKLAVNVGNDFDQALTAVVKCTAQEIGAVSRDDEEDGAVPKASPIV